MNFTFTFTEEDLLSWFRFHQKSSNVARRQRIRNVLTWTFTYFAAASAASFYFKDLIATIACVFSATVLSVASTYIFDLQIDRILTETAAEASRSSGTHEIELLDTGFREITPSTDSLVKWQSIRSVVAEDAHIFVLLDNHAAAVICDRDYSGSVSFDELPETIREMKQKHSSS